MLQKIVFHDNIYQLARNIELIRSGLVLELDEVLFADKILEDIFFCNNLIKNIFDRLHTQYHLHEYINAMNCLYSCVMKFGHILNEVIDIKIKDFHNINVNKQELSVVRFENEKLQIRIADEIREKVGHIDNVNIVSELELSQLLNF